VETPRKFITAKLSIRKPVSSSVLIICDLFNSHALFIYKSVVICWLASFENLIKRHINHVISNVVKWFQLTRAHPRQEKLILHIKESTPRILSSGFPSWSIVLCFSISIDSLVLRENLNDYQSPKWLLRPILYDGRKSKYV
jgi:hypothetical protein